MRKAILILAGIVVGSAVGLYFGNPLTGAVVAGLVAIALLIANRVDRDF